MARPLRVEFPGAVYHVTARGDGREAIFLEEADWRLFLDLLGQTVVRFGGGCHAYCLMPNHCHLLLETPQPNLARGMRHLNGVYTSSASIAAMAAWGTYCRGAIRRLWCRRTPICWNYAATWC